MTDLPGGSIVATGQFQVAAISLPPQYLTIGTLVRISLDDGSIEYGDDYQPDEAARTFWEAMSAAYGGPAQVFGHGLAARVDAELAELRQRAEKAEAAIERVRALHVPARGGRSGYQPDDDDTPGAYGHIASACEECGSQDLAVRWPCPTIQALEET